jgi:hypothetical protein
MAAALWLASMATPGTPASDTPWTVEAREDLRVTTIKCSRELKALLCRTIKVGADQNHMWSEGSYLRQNIEGGKSDDFKAGISAKRLGENLVAHPVSQQRRMAHQFSSSIRLPVKDLY